MKDLNKDIELCNIAKAMLQEVALAHKSGMIAKNPKELLIHIQNYNNCKQKVEDN